MFRPATTNLIVCVLSISLYSAACSDSEDADATPAEALVINELLASNRSGLLDEDGDPSDWVELANRGDDAVNLAGWYLTDDREVLDKWALPDVDLAPGGYLVIFASGKDRRGASGSNLHTNFKLATEGEYLALTKRGEQLEVEAEFSPGYGLQGDDISWGTHVSPGYHFLSPPTPWADNTTSDVVEPPSAPVVFSHLSGVFFHPITLTVTGEGTLHYTLDGERPTLESPTVDGPIMIEESTQVRVGIVDGTSLRDVTTGLFVIAASSLSERVSNLPMMVVDTFGDERVDDEGRPRTYRSAVGAVFEVDDTSGKAGLGGEPTFVGRAGMHIRGNSTAGYPKKQYSFETWDEEDKDRDVSILGFPADSDWVLHAPFADKTLMRNHLMYTWSNRIGRYASRTQFIELYLNKDDGPVTEEDYAGVYVFMEKVKRGSSRVNVESLGESESTEPAITGGYILEKGWNFSEEVGIRTERLGDELLFTYPKADAISSAQRSYLQGYLDDFERALMGSHFDNPELGYEKYIDVDSFIDHHLLVELARNIDGYVLSTYVHKARGGKLQMGPIWDYNGALGNPDYFEGWLTEGWHYQNTEFPADNPNAYHWYERLMEDPAFRTRYSARWRELRASHFEISSLMADIEATAQLLNEAAGRNFQRWTILGEYVWPNAHGFEERDTYQKEIDYMKDWIVERFSWMDAQLAEP